MPYTGTKEQKTKLLRAIRDINERGVPDRKVLEEIARWKRSLAKSGQQTELSQLARVPLSHSAYSSYRRGSRAPDFERAKLIYDFFESGFVPDLRVDAINPFDLNPSSSEGALVLKLLEFIGLEKSIYSYADIACIVGTYTMFRRLWMRPNERLIVASRFEIEYLEETYRIKETQDFSFNDIRVNEQDDGVICPYASNFFGLSRSPVGIKFYTFHEAYPPVRAGSVASELRGTVTGVSSSGPHPSFAFVCKRSADTPLGVLSEHQMMNDQSLRAIAEYIFAA